MFNNKNILITGGTGTLGKAFLPMTLKKFKPKKIIIFSRDEMKKSSILVNISRGAIVNNQDLIKA
jgi:FlaA1/EpsC-like NDP-sugar epimerase